MNTPRRSRRELLRTSILSRARRRNLGPRGVARDSDIPPIDENKPLEANFRPHSSKTVFNYAEREAVGEPRPHRAVNDDGSGGNGNDLCEGSNRIRSKGSKGNLLDMSENRFTHSRLSTRSAPLPTVGTNSRLHGFQISPQHPEDEKPASISPQGSCQSEQSEVSSNACSSLSFTEALDPTFSNRIFKPRSFLSMPVTSEERTGSRLSIHSLPTHRSPNYISFFSPPHNPSPLTCTHCLTPLSLSLSTNPDLDSLSSHIHSILLNPLLHLHLSGREPYQSLVETQYYFLTDVVTSIMEMIEMNIRLGMKVERESSVSCKMVGLSTVGKILEEMRIHLHSFGEDLELLDGSRGTAYGDDVEECRKTILLLGTELEKLIVVAQSGVETLNWKERLVEARRTLKEVMEERPGSADGATRSELNEIEKTLGEKRKRLIDRIWDRFGGGRRGGSTYNQATNEL